MIEAQVVGYVLISLMVGIVYLTSRYISTAKYKGYGLYHIIINAYLRGNKDYKHWIKQNRDYQWCILLIISLIPMILLLIEPFRQNKMFIRPEASLYINVILWGSIMGTYYWLFKKLGKI